MASEDSDQLISRFLAIHRLRDLSDVGQTRMGQMMSAIDETYALREACEVALLGCVHRVAAKERDDRVDQVPPTPNHVAIQVLPVVVMPPIGEHTSHTEERGQFLEARNASRALSHRELVSNLIAGSIAAPARPMLLTDKAD